jgi:hypothetical protein
MSEVSASGPPPIRTPASGALESSAAPSVLDVSSVVVPSHIEQAIIPVPRTSDAVILHIEFGRVSQRTVGVIIKRASLVLDWISGWVRWDRHHHLPLLKVWCLCKCCCRRTSKRPTSQLQRTLDVCQRRVGCCIAGVRQWVRI